MQVELIELQAQPVISIKQRVRVSRLDSFISESISRLAAFAGDGAAAGTPFGIYYGAVNNEHDGPVAVCLPVAAVMPAVGEIESFLLPGCCAARVSVHGADCDFPRILGAYDAAMEWMTKNRYVPDGPPRESWVNLAGPDAHMEILWPFR